MNQLFESKYAPEQIRGIVMPDFSTFGVTLMSHSAGGRVVCSYLAKNCGPVNGLILLDPVDGMDPFGIIKDYVTHPPYPLPFQVPTLIVASGVSSQDGGGKNFKLPPCAPINISNHRFYEVLNGPVK